MTVIAYKSGVLACDSLWTDGNHLKCTYLTKIEKLSNGLLYGGSGDNDDRCLKRLLAQIPRKQITTDDFPSLEKLLEIRQDILAMVITPENQIFCIQTTRTDDEAAGVWPITREFYAIGSGGEMAIGAMAAGKSAIEACEIVCEQTNTCEPPIHHLSLT